MRSVFIGLLLTILNGNLLPANETNPRQFYSQWMKDGREYSFRVHHYKVDPTDTEYKQQYVIFYSAKDEHLYFFDPEEGKYWGRWTRDAEGEKRFSIIDPPNRAAKLADIPEPAFTDPTELPFLPGSDDTVRIASPSAAGGSQEVEIPGDLANLPPEEDFRPEPAAVPFIQIGEPANIRRVARDRRPIRATTSGPYTTTRYKTIWVTEYKQVWVPTYTVTPVVVNGVATQVFSQGGYYKTVPVKVKKVIPYNPAGTGFYGP